MDVRENCLMFKLLIEFMKGENAQDLCQTYALCLPSQNAHGYHLKHTALLLPQRTRTLPLTHTPQSPETLLFHLRLPLYRLWQTITEERTLARRRSMPTRLQIWTLGYGSHRLHGRICRPLRLPCTLDQRCRMPLLLLGLLAGKEKRGGSLSLNTVLFP